MGSVTSVTICVAMRSIGSAARVGKRSRVVDEIGDLARRAVSVRFPADADFSKANEAASLAFLEEVADERHTGSA